PDLQVHCLESEFARRQFAFRLYTAHGDLPCSVARQGLMYWSSQPITVWCHCSELAGFSTQWFSSGNTKSLDSMPRRCRAVKVDRPWAVGMRKSLSPCTT